MMERLAPRAVQRVAGPAWDPLRSAFYEASCILLSVSPETTSELTTIYVKYAVSATRGDVFAVTWIKNSKLLIIGLALPDEVDAPELGDGPNGMVYKRLTKYLTLRPGESLPSEFRRWARLAYNRVANSG